MPSNFSHGCAGEGSNQPDFGLRCAFIISPNRLCERPAHATGRDLVARGPGGGIATRTSPQLNTVSRRSGAREVYKPNKEPMQSPRAQEEWPAFIEARSTATTGEVPRTDRRIGRFNPPRGCRTFDNARGMRESVPSQSHRDAASHLERKLGPFQRIDETPGARRGVLQDR